MRKTVLSILLVLALALTLCACGSEKSSSSDSGKKEETTQAPAQTEQPAATAGQTETEATTEATVDPFYFKWKTVELVCGTDFDSKKMPEEPASTYEVPSCALEGMDIVYNYTAFELTAMNDGSGEKIYSIYLIDPNQSTSEGLYLGDSVDTVKSIYGDEFVQTGTQMTYQRGDTLLIVILSANNTVASIEYRIAS